MTDGKLGVKTAVLTKRERLSALKRVTRARRKPAWRLVDACDIAYGIIPDKYIRLLYLRSLHSDDLFNCAESACIAGKLKPLNPDAPSKDWWVNRVDFQRWVVEQADSIGQERADYLRSIYEPDLRTGLNSERLRAFSSGYTTLELEMCFAVIDEFWSKAKSNNTWRRPKKEEVAAWLKTKYQGIEDSVVNRIYAVTSPEQHKAPRFLND